ncbi:MAG: YdeI/OmpD-associated family protein [Sedimentisphaerales bacterium]|nr:YdeI/OmpD-associated family protein [Sedimentisphaerales bacterium]
MKELYVKTRAQWRGWLSKNHEKSLGVWLVFYKKGTGKATLDYEDAVEEALCFGWVDSIIKKLDDQRYARKVTPRKARSRWSALNKKRVKKVIKEGLMTKAGLAKIEQAKKSGVWQQPDRPQISGEVPEELAEALKKNKKAKAFFDQLAPTYRKQFIGWIAMAKRQETKERRVKEAITLLAKGQKLGMK